MITAGAIFDSENGGWADETVLVIENGRIAELRTHPPVDGPFLDLPEAFVVPGLIDAHTHVLLQGVMDRYELAVQMLEENPGHRIACAVRALRIALDRGFTTIRDVGTEGAGYWDLGLRDAVSEGVVPGPRMRVAGPAIRPTGRYPVSGLPHALTFPVGVASCTGVVACRDEVRTQLAYGVDLIKIYVSGGRFTPSGPDGYPVGPAVFTPAEVNALVDEAHRNNVKIAAHAQCLAGTEMAIAAGVDSIEHGYAIPPEFAREMVARDITLVPTLHIVRDAAVRGWWAKPWVVDSHRRSFANCLEAGVRVAFGTDVGGFEWTGVSQVREFELMVEYGMDPAAALQSATTAAARLLGLADEVGSLTPGKAADLVIVGNDPLSNVAALSDVKLVLKAGSVVYRGAAMAPAEVGFS